MPQDVYLVETFYYGEIDKVIGIFTSFDGAKTAMLIHDRNLTTMLRHDVVSHEEEVWCFGHDHDSGVIRRLPLSGGAV